MRLHSGGYIVDHALYLLGYSPTLLISLKGNHSKKPVICYQGIVDKDFKEELENKANDLVMQNLSFASRFVNDEELKQKEIYLQPGLPTNP
jgi:Ser-tRNA(Ala) deacylase AlaX